MRLAAISMRLITALIQVESQGNNSAVGDWIGDDPTSFGCLQISQKVLDDVSYIAGRRVTVADAFQRERAIWICGTYLNYWVTKERLGRDPTDEDRARTWNGGPYGWRKEETRDYWLKVFKEMRRTDDVPLDFDFRLPSDPPTVRVKIPKRR